MVEAELAGGSMGRRRRRDLSVSVLRLGLEPLDRQMMRHPFNAPVLEPMSKAMMRCCCDSLKFYGPSSPPTEGLEVPCRWCDETAIYHAANGWTLLSEQQIQS